MLDGRAETMAAGVIGRVVGSSLVVTLLMSRDASAAGSPPRLKAVARRPSAAMPRILALTAVFADATSALRPTICHASA